MERTETARQKYTFLQAAPLRRLMRFSWKRPLIGSMIQGLCFGILMSPIVVLRAAEPQLAVLICACAASLFAIGMYPSNRWRHNRPERFGEE
jgi:hypothetical protein